MEEKDKTITAQELNKLLEEPDFVHAFMHANDLANLGIVAPHKEKFFKKYDIGWLENMIQSGKKLKYVTFWRHEDGYENNKFSQWYIRRNRKQLMSCRKQLFVT